MMGSIDLDFRDAEFGPGVTDVNVTNLMGSIGIIVPTDLPVECDGVGILGQFDGVVGRADLRESSGQLLRIRGVALMGHTTVR